MQCFNICTSVSTPTNSWHTTDFIISELVDRYTGCTGGGGGGRGTGKMDFADCSAWTFTDMSAGVCGAEMAAAETEYSVAQVGGTEARADEEKLAGSIGEFWASKSNELF